MNREQSALVVKLLVESVPNASCRVSATTVEAYSRALEDLDYEVAKRAVRALIDTVDFFPSIAAIRRAAAEIQHGNVRSGADAWLDVVKQIDREGYCGTPQFDDPIIIGIIERWGWARLCTEGDPASDRARFIELYNAKANEQRRNELSTVKLASRMPATESRRPLPPESRRSEPMAITRGSAHRNNQRARALVNGIGRGGRG